MRDAYRPIRDGIPRHSGARRFKNQRTNRHHVIPRFLNGPSTPENVITIDARWHAALHMVFGSDHPKDYLVKASTDPEGYARRWVHALARQFGEGILA